MRRNAENKTSELMKIVSGNIFFRHPNKALFNCEVSFQTMSSKDLERASKWKGAFAINVTLNRTTTQKVRTVFTEARNTEAGVCVFVLSSLQAVREVRNLTASWSTKISQSRYLLAWLLEDTTYFTRAWHWTTAYTFCTLLSWREADV